MQGTRVRSPVGELDPTWGAVRLGGVKLVYPLDFFLKKDEHSFLILAEKENFSKKKKKKTLEPCSLQWFLSGVSILTHVERGGGFSKIFGYCHVCSSDVQCPGVQGV